MEKFSERVFVYNVKRPEFNIQHYKVRRNKCI